jgi:Xaa-Pro aminopeptidase
LTDGRYAEQARHEAPDLNRTVYSGQFTRAFGDACAGLGVHTIAFEASGVSYKLYTELLATGVELIPTTDEIESLRTIKDPEELRAVEAAQAVADDAFEAIVLKLSEGVTEKEIALELDTTMRRLGADALAFETILAFGESAAEPHHTPAKRALARGDVVKMDFGCVIDGYHSDMTRTVFFGDPSPDLRAVYEVVRTAQQIGVETARPGMSGGELDAVVRGVITEAGYGDKFGHGLGHGVGLQIHEAPGINSAAAGTLLAGSAVTVEPGVYLPDRGGVRIEDTLVVGETTPDLLTQFPKELAILS